MKLYDGGDPMAIETHAKADGDEQGERKKAPARRRRAVWIGVGVTGVALAALAAASVPVVKLRVGHEIERRCALALGGTCKIGELTVKADGAHARDLRATTDGGAISAEIQGVDVRFGWMDALLARRQGITVHVTGAALTDAAPVDHAAVEVMVLHGLHAGVALPRAMYVSRFEADGCSLRVPIAPFVGARVEGITLRSQSDGALDLRWRDAAVNAGPFAAVSSGACTVTRVAGAREAAIECATVHERVDLDTLMNAGMMSLGLRILRSAVGRVPGLP